MGRQICFFATHLDLKELFTIIIAKNIFLLDNTGKKIDYDDFFRCIDNYFKNENSSSEIWYLASDDSKIKYLENNGYFCVDQIKSDVVEFYHSTRISKKILDTSSVDNLFLKQGFIVIDDVDKYNDMMKELKKKPVYIDNPNYVENGFQYGRFWYNDSYFDENGTKHIKSSSVTAIFNSLKKYMSNNYSLSETKFAYIGPDAYMNFKMNKFIPCCGKNVIEFR